MECKAVGPSEPIEPPGVLLEEIRYIYQLLILVNKIW